MVIKRIAIIRQEDFPNRRIHCDRRQTQVPVEKDRRMKDEKGADREQRSPREFSCLLKTA